MLNLLFNASSASLTFVLPEPAHQAEVLIDSVTPDAPLQWNDGRLELPAGGAALVRCLGEAR
jgi:hypothetical protein